MADLVNPVRESIISALSLLENAEDPADAILGAREILGEACKIAEREMYTPKPIPGCRPVPSDEMVAYGEKISRFWELQRLFVETHMRGGETLESAWKKAELLIDFIEKKKKEAGLDKNPYTSSFQAVRPVR